MVTCCINKTESNRELNASVCMYQEINVLEPYDLHISRRKAQCILLLSGTHLSATSFNNILVKDRTFIVG